MNLHLTIKHLENIPQSMGANENVHTKNELTPHN
jgi:hypothetical protein